MTKAFLYAVIAAMPLLGLTACSSNENDEGKKTVCPAPGISLNTIQQKMVSSQNTFAWHMLSEINANAGGKNSVCSPLSMTYCLGMVNTGAIGNTSDEITTALGFSSGTEDINQYCKKLMKELPSQDNTTTIDIANCVEVNKGHTLKEEYKKTVESCYNALVENRDFRDSGFKDYLNGWIKKRTGGMIPQLFEEINTEAASYIVNALYFKGIWANKFDKSNTAKANFTKADGSKTKVDMMYQTEEFKYTETEQFQALNLNYGNGAYAMQILLPVGEYSVNEVIEAMKEQSWNELTSGMYSREVSVYMPKFTIEYGGEMNGMLNNLGIKTMFTLNAEFPNFCNTDVFVSKVIQKAKIEVDEEGTKAAAATGAEMMDASAGPSNTITFRADHPFIFVITEHSTGTIVFMGVYDGD